MGVRWRVFLSAERVLWYVLESYTFLSQPSKLTTVQLIVARELVKLYLVRLVGIARIQGDGRTVGLGVKRRHTQQPVCVAPIVADPGVVDQVPIEVELVVRARVEIIADFPGQAPGFCAAFKAVAFDDDGVGSCGCIPVVSANMGPCQICDVKSKRV